ncbi:MAG: hypothetical protein RLZZ156_2170 [Deinococcota bacterium]|jgi:ribosomal protein S18 acetylase RimI-like enzyme
MIQEALIYLEQRQLQNITALKMLYTYPKFCMVYALPDGVLILLEPTAMPYDRETYPNATQIVLLYADSSQSTRELLKFVPVKHPTIWKIVSEVVTRETRQHVVLIRQRAFISFTDSRLYTFDSAVSISSSPSQTALVAYGKLGHEQVWLEDLLTRGLAFCCEMKGSVCFAFANHQNIWEVGGVFTSSEYQRQGLAARVVKTCIAELQRRNLRTRYQVHEENLASIGLAKHLGLEQVCTITHWQS